ncbi:MAG: hypothetical protein KF819_25850 [Labilithrix sp.]|nr:hypothetical protein [Labilithrix sp.]
MRGRTLVIAFLAAVVLTAGVIFWIGMSGGSTHVAPGKPGVGFAAPATPTAAPSRPEPSEASEAPDAADD